MPNTLKIEGEQATGEGRACDQESAASSIAVDKNVRPAGRRFQLFTPPSLEHDDALAAQQKAPADLDKTEITVRSEGSAARAVVRRRDAWVGLALAAVVGLAVAGIMLVGLGRQSSSSKQPAPPAHEAATHQQTMPHVSVAAPALSHPVAPDVVSSTPLVSPEPSGAQVAATGLRAVKAPREDASAKTSSSAPAASTSGPAPIAPLEPPF